MVMYYTPVESDAMKSRRMETEPGIDLVKCIDGLWRTESEKSAFEAQEALCFSGKIGKLA